MWAGCDLRGELESSSFCVCLCLHGFPGSSYGRLGLCCRICECLCMSMCVCVCVRVCACVCVGVCAIVCLISVYTCGCHNILNIVLLLQSFGAKVDRSSERDKKRTTKWIYQQGETESEREAKKCDRSKKRQIGQVLDRFLDFQFLGTTEI